MHADAHFWTDQSAGALAGLDEIQIQCRNLSFGIQTNSTRPNAT